jgi:hypothetical protein
MTTPGYELYHKYETGMDETHRLDAETPDEARDEQGLTPEIRAAYLRARAFYDEWQAWYEREQKPRGVSKGELLISYPHHRRWIPPKWRHLFADK